MAGLRHLLSDRRQTLFHRSIAIVHGVVDLAKGPAQKRLELLLALEVRPKWRAQLPADEHAAHVEQHALHLRYCTEARIAGQLCGGRS